MGGPIKRIAAAVTLAMSLIAGNGVTAFAADQPTNSPAVGQKEIDASETYANWDFRRSFREYVGMMWGEGTQEGERLEEGLQHLQPKSYLMWKAKSGQKLDLSGKKGQLKFEGKAYWRKYQGVLEVWIANPTIDFEKRQILVDAYTKGTMSKAKEVTFTQTPVADLKDLTIEQRGDYAVISATHTVLNKNVGDLVGFYVGEKGAPFLATVPLKEGTKAPAPVLWKILPNKYKDPTARPGPAYSEKPLVEVRLPDPGLNKCIRSQFDVSSQLPITNKTLEGIQALNCQGLQIKSLEGLQHAINLDSVNFFRNEITDLSPLSEAKKLTSVKLDSNYLTNLNALKDMKGIETLRASDNLLTDISAVKNMPKLYDLMLDHNRLSDITQLPEKGKLNNALEVLSLAHNKISDLSRYKDAAPFAHDVDLSFNEIADLGSLAQADSVKGKLSLQGNKLTDAEKVANGEFIKHLKKIDVTGNPFTTWTPLVESEELKGKLIPGAPKLNDKGELSEVMKANPKPHDAKSTAEREAGLDKLMKEADALKAAYQKSEKEIAAEQEKRNALKEEKKTNEKSDEKKAQDPADTKKEFKVELNWGVKESFRKYIKGLAHGDWKLSDGTTGEFTFPLKDPKGFTPGKYDKLDFGGKVHFTGHGGVLDITIADPTVRKVDSRWVLEATLSASTFDHSKIGDILTGKIKPTKSEIVTDRIVLATLSDPEITGPEEDQTIRFGSVKITKEGAQKFAGGYEEGKELDPLSITVSTGKADGTDQSKTDDKPKADDKAQAGGQSKQASGTAKSDSPQAAESKADNAEDKAAAKQCVVDPHKKRVTQGTLSWGLRASFTTYIRGAIAHGKWDLNGASWDGTNFNFPVSGGTFNTKTKSGTIYYSGSVHFTGHDGVLDLTISRPSLTINGNSGALYMNVVGSDMSGKKFDLGRVHFANAAIDKISATDTALNFSASSVTLTAAGAKAFAGFYKAGEALAPLSGKATLVPATSCDPKTGELVEYDAFGKKLAHTGAELPAVILAALTMLVMGAGLVVARRRKLDSAVHE
ncbi:HtaA domain-containing protein [Trueperella pyogenes]|uniref:HtaA domain-containing protein n=1 Tax=Trueperella pyogenes TaxID=1661 RepID=UPI00324BEC67